MIKLEVEVPFLPPSNNKSYRPEVHKVRGTNKTYATMVHTTAAKKFKREMKDHIARNYSLELADFKPRNEDIFEIEIITYFDSLKTKTKTAKYPYVRKDVLWGAKLVQDTMSDLLGIDDLYHFDLLLRKRQGPEKVKILITAKSFNDIM